MAQALTSAANAKPAPMILKRFIGFLSPLEQMPHPDFSFDAVSRLLGRRATSFAEQFSCRLRIYRPRTVRQAE
jgi:hypothetical protein